MVEIKATGGPIGAEVSGVALHDVPGPAIIDTIEAALEHHGVLIFRNQQITPAQQIAFSRTLAKLEMTSRADARLDGHPEIFVVGNTGRKAPMIPTPREAHPNIKYMDLSTVTLPGPPPWISVRRG